MKFSCDQACDHCNAYEFVKSKFNPIEDPQAAFDIGPVSYEW